jgi:uncharacterized protein (DUF302 family)
LSTNPYAPPKAEVADIEIREGSPPLWNPNAAASWSLLLSPAFGAFLHMKNWQALGEPTRASAARVWVIAIVISMIALPLLMLLAPGPTDMAGRSNLFEFAVLVSWYITSGRPQIRYVRQRFGRTYPRRGWGKPLLIAFAAVIGYVLLMGFLGAIDARRESVMGTETSVEGLHVLPTHRPVAATLTRIESLAKDRGLTVFARIDFSGDAARAGLTMRPMGLVVLGNPKAGTPLLTATPTIGIDLPLKLLAWEDAAGRTWLAYNEATYLQHRHALPPEFAKNIAGLAALAEAAAGDGA